LSRLADVIDIVPLGTFLKAANWFGSRIRLALYRVYSGKHRFAADADGSSLHLADIEKPVADVGF
jgi:hypothetical protein